KAELPHGRFEQMINAELPFGERTAQCLMAIARDKRLRKRTMVRLLPSCWRTLDELTRLDDAQFRAALADGLITPEMQRSAVEVFRAMTVQVTSSPPQKPPIHMVTEVAAPPTT